jgi:hypothetical protein
MGFLRPLCTGYFQKQIAYLRSPILPHFLAPSTPCPTTQLCGIAMGLIPYTSALVLTGDPEGKRPRNPRFFLPIKAKQPKRLSSILCAC